MPGREERNVRGRTILPVAFRQLVPRVPIVMAKPGWEAARTTPHLRANRARDDRAERGALRPSPRGDLEGGDRRARGGRQGLRWDL